MAWQYHPQEIIWRPRGTSGVARKLAARLQQERPTGWVGHGVNFETAIPAPDTAAALTCTGRETRWIRTGHPDLALQRALLRDFDLAVVEGFVDSTAPWVVELDENGLGLDEIPFGDRSRVIALVGEVSPVADIPPGGIARFRPSEMDDLADHLLDTLEIASRRRPLVGLLLANADTPPDLHATARATLETRCGLVLQEPSSQEAEPFHSRHPGWNQAGLLLTAMELHPDAAVLTLEPSPEAISRFESLMEGRDSLAEATAYRARDTHMPSPACAIWEPRARGRLLGMLSVDIACLRRTLVAAGTHLLDGI